jgi:hypothetical protein
MGVVSLGQGDPEHSVTGELFGLWVAPEGRGAFASSFGFRPTGTRRPMKVTSETDGADEMVMVLPLGADPGTVPSTVVR